jgi:hypothetical protein
VEVGDFATNDGALAVMSRNVVPRGESEACETRQLGLTQAAAYSRVLRMPFLNMVLRVSLLFRAGVAHSAAAGDGAGIDGMRPHRGRGARDS